MLEIYIDRVVRQINVVDRDEVEEKLRIRLGKLLDGKTDDESIQKVIDYLGEPQVLVREYQSDEYLIGPSLYVAYKKVLGILLKVLLILFGVSNLIAILIVSIVSFNFSDLINRVLGMLPQLISIVLYTVAIITLFFAFIEKNMENTTKKIIDAVAVFELKNIFNEIEKIFKSKEGQRGYFYKPVAIIKVIIAGVLLGLLFFTPNFIGHSSNGQLIPILNKAVLEEYQIYMTLVFIGYITLNVLKIIFTRWNWSFATFNTISMLSIFLLVMIVLQDQRMINSEFLETIEIVMAGTVYKLASVWSEVVYFLLVALSVILATSVLFGFWNAFLVYRESKKGIE